MSKARAKKAVAHETVAVSDEEWRLLQQIAALPELEQRRVLAVVPHRILRAYVRHWAIWAHDGQLAPDTDWRVWLIRAGRGFGKTRAGAEWVSEVARRVPEARIALVGANVTEVRRVMIEGPSGLMGVARDEDGTRWKVTSGEVHWPNGSVATVYSDAAPEALRGPEHHAAWCDELAKWHNGAKTWDNLMLTMRQGGRQRVVVTTTPRPTALMRRIIATPRTVETLGRTRDNPHLPETFVEAMFATYGGTRTGRQELDGEMIDDVAGALVDARDDRGAAGAGAACGRPGGGRGRSAGGCGTRCVRDRRGGEGDGWVRLRY